MAGSSQFTNGLGFKISSFLAECNSTLGIRKSAPSPKRIEIINKILIKTRDGFLKEIESVLFVMKAIEKVYNSFSENNKEDKLPFNAKKEALKTATYLSDKITLLSHMRDMGVLRCIDEK